jgi:Glycosyl transferase family 2
MSDAVRVAVIVPTHRRPDALARCLAALATQDRAPNEVVVAASGDDAATAQVVTAAAVPCRLVTVAAPGVLAAMSAGVRATDADVVCFTDDDAEPAADWVARLAAALAADARVGGAGGRDVVAHADGSVEDTPRTHDVGRVTWYGRHVGGHHLGVGPPRDVSFLKGVNAAYRRAALGLPLGLRGDGAEAHFEVAVGRFARAAGYRLVYDPATTVAHHPAPRHGEDQRAGTIDAGTDGRVPGPSPRAVADAAYNLVVAIGGSRGLARVGYAVVLGDRGAPGLGRAAVALATGDRATARRLAPSLRGTLAGAWAILTRRGLRYETFA